VCPTVDVDSAQTQFDLDDYTRKDDLIRAIDAVPLTSSSRQRNNITGAMRTLRTEVLAFGYRGYYGYIQRVALTFVDQRAMNQRELAVAFQV